MELPKNAVTVTTGPKYGFPGTGKGIPGADLTTEETRRLLKAGVAYARAGKEGVAALPLVIADTAGYPRAFRRELQIELDKFAPLLITTPPLLDNLALVRLQLTEPYATTFREWISYIESVLAKVGSGRGEEKGISDGIKAYKILWSNAKEELAFLELQKFQDEGVLRQIAMEREAKVVRQRKEMERLQEARSDRWRRRGSRKGKAFMQTSPFMQTSLNRKRRALDLRHMAEEARKRRLGWTVTEADVQRQLRERAALDAEFAMEGDEALDAWEDDDASFLAADMEERAAVLRALPMPRSGRGGQLAEESYVPPPRLRSGQRRGGQLTAESYKAPPLQLQFERLRRREEDVRERVDYARENEWRTEEHLKSRDKLPRGMSIGEDGHILLENRFYSGIAGLVVVQRRQRKRYEARLKEILALKAQVLRKLEEEPRDTLLREQYNLRRERRRAKRNIDISQRLVAKYPDADEQDTAWLLEEIREDRENIRQITKDLKALRFPLRREIRLLARRRGTKESYQEWLHEFDEEEEEGELTEEEALKLMKKEGAPRRAGIFEEIEQ